MAAVTICIDFGAQEYKVCHCFPSICHEVMGPDAMILVFCFFVVVVVKSLCLFIFFNFNWRLITLQYCIGFAIHQHEFATGIHVFPILNPPPTSLPVPPIPLGHPSAPAPSIQYHASSLDW